MVNGALILAENRGRQQVETAENRRGSRFRVDAAGGLLRGERALTQPDRTRERVHRHEKTLSLANSSKASV